VLADPFTFDVESLIDGLAQAYPGKPIAGGLASGLAYGAWTWLMLNDQPYSSGAIVLGIGGDITLSTVVAQGGIPIGLPGRVTAGEGNRIETIDGRPAADLRREAIDALDEDLRWQAQENLLLGVPASEGASDVLIRDVTRADRRSGIVEIRGHVQVGQPVQYYLADPTRADQQLRAELGRAKDRISAGNIVGALQLSALTRGIELFQVPDHDVNVIKGVLGGVPLAGFFSSGEIAYTDNRPLLHGTTATLVLFTRV
jgi:small ligand-binding sensory domain FIST